MIRKVAIALSFLTIIPINVGAFRNHRELSAAAVYFPLVGGLVGAVFALIAYYTLKFFPPGTVVALLFICSFLLTRGLHVDGLADTADGLLGGLKKERALAIMRDGAVGPLGAFSVFLLYLLKYAALTVTAQNLLPLLFFSMPLCGRWSMVLAGALHAPAREGGLGFQFISTLSLRHFLQASCWASVLLAAGLLAAGTGFICPLLAGTAVSLAMALLIAYLAARSLGGITGDILGAVNETAEVTFILGVLLCIG